MEHAEDAGLARSTSSDAAKSSASFFYVFRRRIRICLRSKCLIACTDSHRQVRCSMPSLYLLARFLTFIVKNTAAAATAITTRAITRIITCFCTCFLRSAFFCSLTASSYRSLLIFSFEPPCDLSKDAELTVLHLHSPVIYQPTFSLNSESLSHQKPFQ